MSITIREDIPRHMAELKAWLETVKDTPPEEMAGFFTARLGSYEEVMSRWAVAYQALAEQIPSAARTLLDIGCGTGLELDAIFRRLPGLSVTGIDLCPAMLDRLREKHPDKGLCLIRADYFQAEIPENAFDAAVSFQTLHHFAPERKQALFEKLHRALKPGGVYLECDYLACCDEEEELTFAVSRRRREAAGIPDDVFVHIDTPLTLPHEIELLRTAGFSAVEPVTCIEGATLLAAVK